MVLQTKKNMLKGEVLPEVIAAHPLLGGPSSNNLAGVSEKRYCSHICLQKH
jgi:hypothetical protein